MASLCQTLVKKSNPKAILSRSLKVKSPSVCSSSFTSPLHQPRFLLGFTKLTPFSLNNCLRCFSSCSTKLSYSGSSQRDHPAEDLLLSDGCDLQHWLIVVEKPEGELSRDEIIDSYIKLVAVVYGSQEEARKKIYSVSTKHYYAIGVLGSEELSVKFNELPNVRWVLPDSYLNFREKEYGGEPFIDGQAVPYDPKYHQEWTENKVKLENLLDGCDFKHWLVVVEKPEGDPSRDEIIDSYIKLVASVYGSEDEARKNIYSVSTKHYYAIGVIVSEELSVKFKQLPNVRWVLPDSYLNTKDKDYGGESFINGQAVPYDPKYHKEWTRNCRRSRSRVTCNQPNQNFGDPGKEGTERK